MWGGARFSLCNRRHPWPRWSSCRLRVRDTRKILEDGALVPSQEEPLLPLLTGYRRWRAVDRRHPVGSSGDGPSASPSRRPRWCGPRRSRFPTLDILLAALPDTEPLRRRIVKSLDKRGRVRDDASPQLVRLRRQAHRVRDGLYKVLQKTLVEEGEHFSEDTVSLKDGRLTLVARGQGTRAGRGVGSWALGKRPKSPFRTVVGGRGQQPFAGDDRRGRDRAPPDSHRADQPSPERIARH